MGKGTFASILIETTVTLGRLINGATAKTEPHDDDMLALMDSQASNVVKKLSWTYVKSRLLTYFSNYFGSKQIEFANTETRSFTLQASNLFKMTFVDRGTDIACTIPEGLMRAGDWADLYQSNTGQCDITEQTPANQTFWGDTKTSYRTRTRIICFDDTTEAEKYIIEYGTT